MMKRKKFYGIGSKGKSLLYLVILLNAANLKLFGELMIWLEDSKKYKVLQICIDGLYRVKHILPIQMQYLMVPHGLFRLPALEEILDLPENSFAWDKLFSLLCWMYSDTFTTRCQNKALEIWVDCLYQVKLNTTTDIAFPNGTPYGVSFII